MSQVNRATQFTYQRCQVFAVGRTELGDTDEDILVDILSVRENSQGIREIGFGEAGEIEADFQVGFH